MVKGIIIPQRFMEVKKIIDIKLKALGIGLHKNMLMVKTANTVLRVSLLDADYPDYTRVIPSEQGIGVVLDKVVPTCLKKNERCFVRPAITGYFILLREEWF